MVSWLLTVGLIVFAYASPFVLPDKKPMLYLIAVMFGFSSLALCRLMPEDLNIGIRYEVEDKVLVESLVMILLLTAYLYVMAALPAGVVFLYLLPIIIETTVLHERVILAETVFGIMALLFLRLATQVDGSFLDFDFALQLAVFLAVSAALVVLTRRLRTSSEKNEQLSGELSRRLDQIQVIVQLVQQSQYFRQFDRLLNQISEITADAFDAEQCGLFLYNPEKDQLRLHRSSVGFRQADYELFSVSENLKTIRQVFEEDKPLFINLEPGVKTEFADLIGYRHLKNLMLVPLRIREARIGVAFVSNRRMGGFAATDVSFLSILAGFISTLIDSASSFQKVVKEQQVAEHMTKLLVGREIKMRELKKKLSDSGEDL